MSTLWFAIVALMLAAYVVLDGFDFGAGILHLFVARTNAQRRQVLAAIGPYWDGNEVWLLAAGGALFLAFPKALAAGLSGFYFAIFLVLWCLIGRGVAIEFRSHVNEPLWRAFWDAAFAIASALLAIFFGAALGNVIRGVPLSADGWFALALFTDFTARGAVGILDWYTVLVGVFALLAIAAHGAAFLAWKTDGEVEQRSRGLARPLFLLLTLLWPLITFATSTVNPAIYSAFVARPLAWLCAALAFAGLAAALFGTLRRASLVAFLGSCGFIAGLLAATATCVFPTLLRAIPDPTLSITAANASVEPSSLRTALGWFVIGLPLALLYFTIVFRLHRGKAVAAAEGEGY